MFCKSHCFEHISQKKCWDFCDYLFSYFFSFALQVLGILKKPYKTCILQHKSQMVFSSYQTNFFKKTKVVILQFFLGPLKSDSAFVDTCQFINGFSPDSTPRYLLTSAVLFHHSEILCAVNNFCVRNSIITYVFNKLILV